MRRFHCVWRAAAFSLLAAVAAAAGEGDDLLKANLQAIEKAEAIEQERQQLMQPFQADLQALQSVHWRLGQKPPEEREVEQLKQQLAQTEAELARLRAELRTAGIKDPELRAAKCKEAGDRLAKVQAQADAAAKPATDKHAALDTEHRKQGAEMVKLICRHVKEPAGDFQGLKRRDFPPQFLSGFYAIHWEDAAGKQAAWVHIRVKPALAPAADQKKLDGKHVIVSQFSNSLWVRAGHFELAFSVDKEEWQQPVTVAKLLKALFDLDELAKLGAP